jgi:hypothetical protein
MGGGAMRGPGLDRPMMEQFDGDKNGAVSQAEFNAGFVQWFTSWNADKSGQLTETQLREGLNRDMNPMRGGPPMGGPPR